MSDVSDGTLIGIIGAGRLGQAMATTALRAGRNVMLANSRGPGTLNSVIASLPDGASAGTVEQAAGARLVVLGVPWPNVRDAVGGLTWSGQVVLDATNDFSGGDPDGRTSSEVVAELLPGARVVKAGNTLGAPVLAADPHNAGGQRVMFVSGDDPDAKSAVVQLFEDAGFFTVDLGGLVAGGRMQQIGGPLSGLNLIRFP